MGPGHETWKYVAWQGKTRLPLSVLQKETSVIFAFSCTRIGFRMTILSLSNQVRCQVWFLSNFRRMTNKSSSGIASPEIWRGKMFDFRRITLFCLETRLSKGKMNIFCKNLEGAWPFWPPLATPMKSSALMIFASLKFHPVLPNFCFYLLA